MAYNLSQNYRSTNYKSFDTMYVKSGIAKWLQVLQYRKYKGVWVKRRSNRETDPDRIGFSNNMTGQNFPTLFGRVTNDRYKRGKMRKILLWPALDVSWKVV